MSSFRIFKLHYPQHHQCHEKNLFKSKPHSKVCVLDLVQLEDDLEVQYCQVTDYIRRRLNKIQYTDFIYIFIFSINDYHKNNLIC